MNDPEASSDGTRYAELDYLYAYLPPRITVHLTRRLSDMRKLGARWPGRVDHDP